MEIAESIDSDLMDIPFVARAVEQKDSDGKPQIRVDLQIDFSRIAFKTTGDRHTCTLHIAVFSADEKGKTLEPQFRTLEGMLREETYNLVLKTGLSVSLAIPAKAPKQRLKMVLYDEVGDAFGSQRTQSP
jgi:hypothetical protein